MRNYIGGSAYTKYRLTVCVYTHIYIHIRLLPRLRRRRLLVLVLHDAIHRRSLPGLLLSRRRPPRGRGRRAIKAHGGGEEAPAWGRRRRAHRSLRRGGRLRRGREVGEVIEGEQRGRWRRGGCLGLAPDGGGGKAQRRGDGGGEIAVERRVVPPVVWWRRSSWRRGAATAERREKP
jgi:hypothetical protein